MDVTNYPLLVSHAYIRTMHAITTPTSLSLSQWLFSLFFPWLHSSLFSPWFMLESPTSTPHQHQFSSLNHHLHFPPAFMELYMHGHLPLHLYFSLFLSNTEPTTRTITQTATSVTTQTAIRFVFCHRERRFSEALLPWQCVPVIPGRSMQRGFPVPPPQQQQSRLEVAS